MLLTIPVKKFAGKVQRNDARLKGNFRKPVRLVIPAKPVPSEVEGAGIQECGG